MNAPSFTESERVAELRRAFDQNFAVPVRTASADLISLIAIGLGSEAFVLRADQIMGIARLPRIVPAPSRIQELMGIAGMRGTLVPVFSLAALLGLPRSGECAWLALVHPESPAGLAFDALGGQLVVGRAHLYEDENPACRYVRQLVQIGDDVRPVIHVPSLMEALRPMAEPPRR